MDGTVQSYLLRRDWRIKENANVGFSIQGLNARVVGEVAKEFWLSEVYPREAAVLHREGVIHIHNLSLLTPYCVGWDLLDLLIKGYRAENGVVSKPPKHFRTALLQLANFLFTLQGEAAGAVAVANFDTLLSPFVWRDGLSYAEVRQCLQEFVFNMNVPTRVGMQTPFSNLTVDILCPKGLEDVEAVVGGEPCGVTYGMLSRQRLMIVRALFEVLAEGDASGRPFTFPIPTVDVNGEFPWDEPLLDPLWEATARYGIPYFANFLTTGRSRDEVRSMCCRLRLDVGRVRQGGPFAAHPLTGSIGVITLNLPGIALRSRNFQDFLAGVRYAARVAAQALERKREFLEEMTERGLYPNSRYWLEGVKAERGRYWGNHFSTLGVIGAHEALLNLGYEGGIVEHPEKAEAVLRELVAYTESLEGLWNVEATPGEGASHSLAILDVRNFGERAHHQGPKEAPYYTNSTQLPPGATDDLFFALSHQARLQPLYTGGTVFHVWLGERVPSVEAVKRLLRRILEGFPLPYITLTPTYSVCPAHGYLSGAHEVCPECGRDCEVYSRVVGYLRPVHLWNPGKRAEFAERKFFAV